MKRQSQFPKPVCSMSENTIIQEENVNSEPQGSMVNTAVRAPSIQAREKFVGLMVYEMTEKREMEDDTANAQGLIPRDFEEKIRITKRLSHKRRKSKS